MRKRDWLIPVIIIIVVISAVLFAPVNLMGVFSGEIGDTLTITTSIYATLITILLALLALAVTAYVFLATALKERREHYEQKAIEQLLTRRTVYLLFLTVSGIVSLVFCFLIDNTNSQIPFAHWVRVLTIIGSSVVSILLMIYICHIIAYEHGLRVAARKARRKQFSSPILAKKKELNASALYKSIGDLEMLVMTLVHGHEDEFHGTDVSDTIRAITSDEFTATYEQLVSYRDFLRVEQQKHRADIRTTDDENSKVQEAIQKLEDELKQKWLKGERLKNLNFIKPFLAQSNVPFCLNATVFTQSAFEAVDFSKASLQSADFSQVRLNEVNLEEADCTEALFSGAVFRRLKVNAKSVFDKAVFRDADFGRQEFCADNREVFCFKNASFVKANLIECVFQACDFRYANFNEALMANIVLDSVCLSYADLSRAILTGAKLQFQQEKASCFPVEQYWKSSQVDQEGRPYASYTDCWRGQRLGPAFFANLERSTWSQACLSACNFAGSRMADANFSDASIENCIFDRCYGQRATFQETLIRSCRFQYAMFDTADLSHAQIIDCDFSDVNLRDSLMVKAEVRGASSQARSCFQRANFTNAQLRGCLFVDCDFKAARFVDADLVGASFYNCDLSGALFDGTDHDTFTVADDCIGYARPKDDLPSIRGASMEGKEEFLSIERAIQKRKSTRSFDRSSIIEKECLDSLLHAALQAPSPKNRQPWHFTVVTEKGFQEELAQILEQKTNVLRASRLKQGKGTDDLDLARGSIRVLRDASALVFVTYVRDEKNEHGDTHDWSLCARPFEAADLQSIGAAIENMLLTAEAFKIDSLWMCDVLYAYQEYMDYLRLKTPLVACIALGYQTEHHTPRASLDEKVEYWN